MGDNRNPGILIFEQKNKTKGVLHDLWGFYSPLKINNTSVPDISALFAKYSKIENGKVILDLNLIGNVNASAKGVIKLTESDLRNIIKRVISEQFDMDYYDIILDLIDNPWFQRLRRIKQLGMSHLVYPGALHTRFHHAMGAMFLMKEAIDVIRSKGQEITEEEAEAVTIAILLHDIGHGPCSHALEHSIAEGIHHEELLLLFKSVEIKPAPDFLKTYAICKADGKL